MQLPERVGTTRWKCIRQAIPMPIRYLPSSMLLVWKRALVFSAGMCNSKMITYIVALQDTIEIAILSCK
jgi:hypothetical protein